METSAEVVFAQRLAANEPKVRDRAVKKLRKYLTARASHTGFTEEELLKLWKGLHYCFWMQDKPLLQEELSSRMCSLLKVFPDGQSALKFARAFFSTQANEWPRLDQWRIDKYMMLIRDFLHATFQMVKSNHWEEMLVSTMSQLIDEEVMNGKKEDNSDGLRLHLADIYLEELTKVGADELQGDQINILLKPFVNFIINSKRDLITKKISDKIFGTILETVTSATGNKENADETNEEAEPKLQYNPQAIQKLLFDCGKKTDVMPRARKTLYQLVKRFSAVSTESEEQPKLPVKRKQTDVVEDPPKKKKQKVKTAKSEQTPLKKVKAKPEKETPKSSQKNVSFDLARNSSRGLQEFVMSASSSESPYLPSRSPKQGILKDSPGREDAKTGQSSSKKSQKLATTSAFSKGTKHTKGGKSYPSPKLNTSSDRGEKSGKKHKSFQREKSPQFRGGKNRRRAMKRPKRY